MLSVLWGQNTLADTFVFYDDALGTLPSDQNLAFIGLGGTQTVLTQGTEFDSTSFGNTGIIGYNNAPSGVVTLSPALDRSAGFHLNFELQINSEFHASTNRAGFSVIVVSNDLLGIELGFWSNEIWAQSGPNFTRAESVSYDNNVGETSFGLHLAGDSYSLTANGAEVLTGALRDYTPWDHTAAGLPLPFDPYEVPNFVFLGDNTSSARAQAVLGDIAMHTGLIPPTTVPLPAGFGLLCAALLSAIGARRKLDG